MINQGENKNRNKSHSHTFIHVTADPIVPSYLSPAECILEALTICLECNNSVFHNIFYLQENVTAIGPHMPCSYSDIAMYWFDIKALNYRPGVQCWKRFRNDIFCLWNHFLEVF